MLRIRLKVKPQEDSSEKLSLKCFVLEYINNFYIELDSLLGDYRSIQEHGNRNKIIDFVNQKLKDFDLFCILVKGAYYYKNLKRVLLKKEDYSNACSTMVDIADFLAHMFENMKASFIPKHDINLALISFIDHRRLLPKDIQDSVLNKIEELKIGESSEKSDCLNSGQEKINFDEIHRIMKLYLLKDGISDYKLKDGILYLQNKYFVFEIILDGPMNAQKWRILTVKTTPESKIVESHLIRRLSPSLPEIVAFMNFYKSRKLAHDSFCYFQTSVDGFYQKFSGRIHQTLIKAEIRNNQFRVKIQKENSAVILVNKKPEDILEIIDHKEMTQLDKEESTKHFSDGFRKDIFGENFVFYVGNLFICFSTKKPEFYIGELSKACGLQTKKMYLQRESLSLVGYTQAPQSYNPLDLKYQPSKYDWLFDKNYYRTVEEFFVQNRIFFPLLYKMLDYDLEFTLNGKLISPFFELNSSMLISYNIIKDNQIIPTIFEAVDETAALNKMRLLRIQHQNLSSYNVLENKIGEKIILEIHDIKVLISGILKSDLKYLTEDCRSFSFDEALEFICNFGVFYKFNLLPIIHSKTFVTFDLRDFSGEFFTIIISNGLYKLHGRNTMTLLKLNRTVKIEDSRLFGLLSRAYLINRFNSLKRCLIKYGAVDQSSNNPQIHVADNTKHSIDIKNGSKLVLTPEGLKFFTENDQINMELSRALNTERNPCKALKEYILHIQKQ